MPDAVFYKGNQDFSMEIDVVADLPAGTITFVGTVAGVNNVEFKAGQVAALDRSGVYTVPKDSALVLAEGAEVDWDGSKVVAAAGGNKLGTVVEPGGGKNGRTYTRVALNLGV